MPKALTTTSDSAIKATFCNDGGAIINWDIQINRFFYCRVFSFTLETTSDKHFDQQEDIFHLEKKKRKEKRQQISEHPPFHIEEEKKKKQKRQQG